MHSLRSYFVHVPKVVGVKFFYKGNVKECPQNLLYYICYGLRLLAINFVFVKVAIIAVKDILLISF